MGTLWTLAKNLPQLLALVSAMEAAIKQAQTDRKVKNDLTALTGALNAQDINQVNHLFNAPGSGGVQPVATLETKY